MMGVIYVKKEKTTFIKQSQIYHFDCSGYCNTRERDSWRNKFYVISNIVYLVLYLNNTAV